MDRTFKDVMRRTRERPNAVQVGRMHSLGGSYLEWLARWLPCQTQLSSK